MTQTVALHPRLLTRDDVLLDRLSSVEPLAYADYLVSGGYQGWARARSLAPSEVLDVVRQSGLLGRGGAGFSTARKWEMVSGRPAPQKYLVCNAAEDEPGTFKDRYLLRDNPHQLLEGVLIAAWAVSARVAYIYINGHYTEEIAFMERAIEEAGDYFHAIPGDPASHKLVEVKVVKSPGTYVAGEETAVLEVIEGRVAAPRQKPPYYPAASGLFGMPTAVNNAETLANLPYILRNGPDAFRSVGAGAAGSGTLIFTLTGDVCRPGIYERPLGTSLRELIEVDGGGVKDGHRLKAFFPGGPSNTILTADAIDTPLDYPSLRKAGSGLGTGAVIVFSEAACMVKVAIEYGRFFARESCGQCPPCVLGLKHLSETMEKIEAGGGNEKDVRQVEQICGMIKGRGYCYLLTGAAIAVESIFRHFKHEFDAHIHTASCPIAHPHSA
jgi:NADH-quinone oxidoreductase subunit F